MTTHASRQAVYMRSQRRWRFNWRLLWNWFVVLLGIVLLILAGRKLLEPQTLPIKQIQALGTFTHINEDMLRQVVARTVQGGYFTVNVDEVQKAVQEIPWVAQDSVRRVWPDTLAIEVIEQQAAAEWSKGGLVNSQGVLFFPARDTYPKGLPVFDGPAGMERNMTEAYIKAKVTIDGLNLQIREIHMDSRRAISLLLSNGIQVIVGREAMQARLDRFARVYRKILGARADDIARVDLRYSNGLAVGWRKPRTS